MRQAGHVAAAGIISITKMVDRLAEDHANARRLAELVDAIDGISVDLASVETNMVYADLSALGVTTSEFVAELEKRDLMVSPIPPTRIRMVTHRHVTASDVDQAAVILAEVAERVRR
jgi:threonine aldolase